MLARLPPSQLSHYRIVRAIGRGAMGEVYRAVDTRLGREVALKVLPREVEADPGWQARLWREAQAASALNHPGIVTLHDLGQAEGRTFLVMELVEGEPCGRLARRGVDWRRALAIVADVADALAAAHALGILHRDIKSDNLMVLPGGQVKVLDFGLAKAVAGRGEPGSSSSSDLGEAPAVGVAATVVPTGDDGVAATAVPTGDAGIADTVAPVDDAAIAATLASQPSQPSGRGQSLASDLTQAGYVVGTPAYMAPESYDGQTDVRSEVFSLGVVLYELLVGARPFDRATPLATQAAIQLDQAPPPSQAAPERAIPAAVDRLVAQALAKEPAARVQDMTRFAAALRALLAPPPRRPAVWWALAAVPVVAGAAVGGWWLTRARGAALPAPTVTASRRLTLDAGCEDYPRFTPDGQRVVYDGLVDGDYELLSIAVDGSDRRRLTHAPGWDYAAAVSPDGGRVAYVHEGADGRQAMVVALAGGAPRALGGIAGYPAWTADGALLVGDDTGRILRWDLAGDGPPRVTVLGRLPTGARPYHLSEVAGDGVAVLWWTSSDAETSALGELDRAGRLRVVEEGATDYEGGLAPAPGRHGYYVTRKAATTGNEVWRRRWGDRRAVVVPGGLSPRAGLSVAPDGSALVFSTCFERQALVRLRADGTLTPLPAGEWQDGSPAPVGTGAVLFTSDRQGPRQGWLLELASGAARPVTPLEVANARPSPAGDRIVYVAGGGRGGLATVALAGGEPATLTTDPTDATPTFAAGGAEVVFVRTVDGGRAVLHRVAATGGAVVALADGSEPTAAGRVVVFLGPADAAGNRALLRTDLGGAPATPLPGVAPADWRSPRLSADGTRLLVLRGYLEVVELAVDGSAPPRTWWRGATDGISAIDWAPDGDGAIAARGRYDGDLWLARGRFP